MFDITKLWPSARRAIRRDAIVLEKLQAQTITVPLVVEKQPPDSRWCWAAVSASVSKYYNAASQWTQCKVATAEIGTPCCGAPCPSAACNKDRALDSALSYTGNFRDWLDSQLRPAQIQAELSLRNPVGIRVEWSDRTGHFLTIVGITESGADPTLHLSDPLYDDCTLPLSFMNGDYQHTGTWKQSYLIQNDRP